MRQAHDGKKLTKTLKKQLKRRSAIEPMIGHMKQDGRLNLSRLKGISGDQINAILVAAGHNLRLILNHIRKLLKENPLKLMKIVKNLLSQILSSFFRTIYLILENILKKCSGIEV